MLKMFLIGKLVEESWSRSLVLDYWVDELMNQDNYDSNELESCLNKDPFLKQSFIIEGNVKL